MVITVEGGNLGIPTRGICSLSPIFLQLPCFINSDVHWIGTPRATPRTLPHVLLHFAQAATAHTSMPVSLTTPGGTTSPWCVPDMIQILTEIRELGAGIVVDIVAAA